MSLKEQMLTYFEQPEVNARIVDYVARNNLDISDLDEATLVRMMDDLQLLEDIQERVKEEQSTHQSLKNLTHNLTLTITKGRKFKPFLELPRPAMFFFTLSAFGQKAKSSTYEVA
jgi:predicted transcriptional regulator